MQTGAQLIESFYAKGPAERIGLKDNVWRDTLRKWVGQGYPTDGDGNPVSPEDHFGYDMVAVGAAFPWKAKLDPDEPVEETDEWRVVRDGNGATFKWWKDKSGTPEHVEFAMTSRDVWEREYKGHVVGSLRRRATQERLEGLRARMQHCRDKQQWVDVGFRGIWENMRAAFGDVALYENMLLDPDWIKDYCRTYTDLYSQELELVVAEVGRPDGAWFYDDLGYKGATFCSPELFGSLIFPFYEELNHLCHSHGLKVVLHTCGYTEPVLDLIVASGFDGVNPLEVKAGNNILSIAEDYAGKLLFVGGLDARILETHDAALIRREVAALLNGLKQRGARFVFGSDHSLSTNIDYDDFRCALDAYREHMMY